MYGITVLWKNETRILCLIRILCEGCGFRDNSTKVNLRCLIAYPRTLEAMTGSERTELLSRAHVSYLVKYLDEIRASAWQLFFWKDMVLNYKLRGF
jgi:hypothetical protein